MKSYTITQLKNIAKEQSYRLACLEDSQGNRKQSFNNPRTSIEKQFSIITQRLKSEILPDGIYYVCMAQNINSSRDADRYPVVKGELTPEILKESNPEIKIIEKQENVLSYASALEMQKEIAELTAENTALKKEVLDLQLVIEDLENDEGEGLSNPEPSNAVTFLKETLPSIFPMIDKYFEQQERKLNLEELKLKNNIRSKTVPKRVPLVVGSQQHLTVIEHYFNTKQDDKLNDELDKLKEKDPKIYNAVLEKLGLTDEEETVEEGGANE